MSVFDFVLLFIGVGLMGFGFTQGLVKMGVGLLGFYLALVLTALILDPVSRWLGRALKVEQVNGIGYQGIVFFVLLLLITTLLVFALVSTFKSLRLPNSLLIIDQVGGLLVGAVVALIAVVLLATIIRAISANGGSTELTKMPFFGWMFVNADRSGVVSLFYNLSGVVKALLSPVPDSQNLFIFR